MEALSKTINTIKDLDWGGGGIDRIYQLLGDKDVTRWLSTICDDTCNDQKVWSKLTESLEEELRVQQQKLLIQGKSDEKRFRSHHKEKCQYSATPYRCS